MCKKNAILKWEAIESDRVTESTGEKRQQELIRDEE